MYNVNFISFLLTRFTLPAIFNFKINNFDLITTNWRIRFLFVEGRAKISRNGIAGEKSKLFMKYVSRVSSEIVLHEHCDKRCHVGRFAHGAAFHETWCRMQQLLAIEFAGCEESSRASMAQKIKAAAAATSAARLSALATTASAP